MNTAKKFKTALGETRLLMLGAQIVFGFQFNGIFQSAFDTVPQRSRLFDAAAILLMSLTIGLLIAPSACHRLAHRGQVDARLFRETAAFAGLALLPFSICLAIDIYIVMARVQGEAAAYGISAFFWVTALVLWYVLEFLARDRKVLNAQTGQICERIALSARIEQMLTEARVVLPGAQALLGFQLIAMLTQAFDRLPRLSQLVHAGALACVAFTVIMLIAPAAFHRIAFGGADSERFYRIGSFFVTVALFPLALGLALDTYVATAKLTAAQSAAIGASVAVLLLLLLLWYAYPLLLRRRVET